MPGLCAGVSEGPSLFLSSSFISCSPAVAGLSFHPVASTRRLCAGRLVWVGCVLSIRRWFCELCMEQVLRIAATPSPGTYVIGMSERSHVSRLLYFQKRKSFQNKYPSMVNKQRSPPLLPFRSHLLPRSPVFCPLSTASSWVSVSLVYVHLVHCSPPPIARVTFPEPRSGQVAFPPVAESNPLCHQGQSDPSRGFPGIRASTLSCHVPCSTQFARFNLTAV